MSTPAKSPLFIHVNHPRANPLLYDAKNRGTFNVGTAGWPLVESVRHKTAASEAAPSPDGFAHLTVSLHKLVGNHSHVVLLHRHKILQSYRSVLQFGRISNPMAGERASMLLSVAQAQTASLKGLNSENITASYSMSSVTSPKQRSPTCRSDYTGPAGMLTHKRIVFAKKYRLDTG